MDVIVRAHGLRPKKGSPLPVIHVPPAVGSSATPNPAAILRAGRYRTAELDRRLFQLGCYLAEAYYQERGGDYALVLKFSDRTPDTAVPVTDSLLAALVRIRKRGWQRVRIWRHPEEENILYSIGLFGPLEGETEIPELPIEQFVSPLGMHGESDRRGAEPPLPEPASASNAGQASA